ncbi:hypothetical protein [Streptomyces sp. MMS24-I29]|uniref:hypothetical protein n=1 Tax=Streptomyces sp. MMS24-I29 TaxID=3351480 RepID=UPI003C7B8877
MAGKTVTLCACRAIMLANNDESGCRDYHGHTHKSVDVPADTVITRGPQTWSGIFDLDCSGHEGGIIHLDETYWTAEITENRPAATE